jgi:hypothetical protein
LICADLRAKRAKFATLKKVISFIFKYFLASFPLFFILRYILLSPRAGTISLPPGRWGQPALAYGKVSLKRPQV